MSCSLLWLIFFAAAIGCRNTAQANMRPSTCSQNNIIQFVKWGLACFFKCWILWQCYFWNIFVRVNCTVVPAKDLDIKLWWPIDYSRLTQRKPRKQNCFKSNFNSTFFVFSFAQSLLWAGWEALSLWIEISDKIRRHSQCQHKYFQSGSTHLNLSYFRGPINQWVKMLKIHKYFS